MKSRLLFALAASSFVLSPSAAFAQAEKPSGDGPPPVPVLQPFTPAAEPPGEPAAREPSEPETAPLREVSDDGSPRRRGPRGRRRAPPASGRALSPAPAQPLVIADARTPLGAEGAEGARPPAPPPRVRLGAGVRVTHVTGDAFDLFASDDALTQLSLDASYALIAGRRFSLAVGGAWDVGSRSSGARGLTTSLEVHRLSAPIEARVHLAPYVYLFGRVAPGALLMNSEIGDPSAATSLEDSRWVFSGDLSVGGSLRIAQVASGSRRPVGFWLTPEFGYGITGSASVRPTTDRDADDVLGADMRTRLGAATLGGFFWRAALAVTY